MSDLGEVSWNERIEDYFVKSGEQAHGLSYIHKRAEEIYSRQKQFIDIPQIVLSTVVGFLQVGSASMFAGEQFIASIALGTASLFVSVLGTVGSYFQWSKRAEGHRISAIQYSKLYRFLSIEMALPREERMSPTDLLKYTKENIDRLAEISPLLPPALLQEFRHQYQKDAERKGVAMPEEAEGLEKILVFQEPPQTLFPVKSPSPPPATSRPESVQQNPSDTLSLKISIPQQSKDLPVQTSLPLRRSSARSVSVVSPPAIPRATADDGPSVSVLTSPEPPTETLSAQQHRSSS